MNQSDLNLRQEENPLEKFTQNLTTLAAKGKLDPVIGRDQEIRRIMQILSRRTKNNPVLLGDPGVGKTAVCEGLAQRIVSKDVPDTLKNKEVLVLDMAGILAGSAFRGEFEQRIKNIVREVSKAEGKYILFIDEMHTIVGAGSAEGSVDAANILKPALARGELRVIGATTTGEYRKYIEKDKALERRFQPVFIDEPSSEDSVSILRGIKEKYEIHHGIRITDEAIIAAVNLSRRYIPDRFLPDKAIDLMDEAASSIKIDIESKPQLIDDLKRRLTQLEIERAGLKKENRESAKAKREEISLNIKKLERRLEDLTIKWQVQKKIISDLNSLREDYDLLRQQMEGAEREVDLEKAAEIKYGKIPLIEDKLKKLEKDWISIPEDERLLRDEVTEDDISKIVSRWTGIPVSKMKVSDKEKYNNLNVEMQKMVFGQQKATDKVSRAIMRNMAGLGEAKRPIGSFLFLGPTGVGKTETAKALARILFNDEKMMVRIDMSEYQEEHAIARLIGAPPGYIGYEEGGQLTEAVRRRPYSVILLDEIEKANPKAYNLFLQVFDDGRLTDGRGRTVDFTNTLIIMTSNLGSEIILKQGASNAKTRQDLEALLYKTFRPEFINRIDSIVIFESLSDKALNLVVERELAGVADKLKEKRIKFTFSPGLVDHLKKEGFDPYFGARPLKRIVQEKITDELAFRIMNSTISEDDIVKADYSNGKIIFSLPH